MTTITPQALKETSHRLSAKPWRVVEAQHRAATRPLVDTLAEQPTREERLEACKPLVAAHAAHLR